MPIIKVNNLQLSTKNLELTEDYNLDIEDSSIVFIQPQQDQLRINLPNISEDNNPLKITGLAFKFYNLSSIYMVVISCVVDGQVYNYSLTPKNSINVVFNGKGWLFDNNFDLHLYDDDTFGVCRLYTGGGSGTWCHVDSTGNQVTIPDNFFEDHSIYGQIVPVQIDGQYMVRIPKFYVKYETITDPNDSRNLPLNAKIKYISPYYQEGYHLHPAFKYNNKELDCFYIGQYKGSLDGSGKLASIPNVLPTIFNTNVNETIKSSIAARNINNMSGFMAHNIYQRAAIQLLILAEYGTPDIQSILGGSELLANSQMVNVNDDSNSVWRGIYGLYGNAWEFVDGIMTDDNLNLKLYSNDGTQTYLSTNIPVVSPGGWIVDVLDNVGQNYNFNDLFIPSEVSNVETDGSYGDRYNNGVAKEDNVCTFGGCYGGIPMSYYGIFYFSFMLSSSYCARLAKV